jgi:hypothetical protein
MNALNVQERARPNRDNPHRPPHDGGGLHRVAESNARPVEVDSTIKHIAFLGDHLPRQCGIATFTSDICEAVAVQYPQCECVVGAVNDRPDGYHYPPQVRFEIDEKELDSYRRAADFLNISLGPARVWHLRRTCR